MPIGSRLAAVPSRALAALRTPHCPYAHLRLPHRHLSLRATQPLLRKPKPAAKSKSRPDLRSDIWPESVNAAAARPSPVARPYKPLPYDGREFEQKDDFEYEKDEDYDEAADRARARRERDEQVRRGYAEHKQAVNQLFAQRQLPFVGAALAAAVLGFCTMPLLLEYLMGRCNDCGEYKEVAPDAVPTGLPPMGAAAFDVSLDVPEKMMGIGRLRARLAGAAEGDTLEVAVGTGRNVQFYTWNPYVFEPEHSRIDAIAPDLGEAKPLTSFTGVDLSGDALGITRRRLRVHVPAVRREIKAQGRETEFNEKIEEASPSSSSASTAATATSSPSPTPTASVTTPTPTPTTPVFSAVDTRVRLFRGDALNPLPPAADLPPASRGPNKPAAPNTAPGKYDTVIQTFGLCSVADPVLLVKHMADAVKPDTGRIVLLEHGRADWGVVNSVLDRYAGRHFSRFGCWWNRDLLGIVEQARAAVPGLEVVEVSRPGLFQFGTLYWIELRVKSE